MREGDREDGQIQRGVLGSGVPADDVGSLWLKFQSLGLSQTEGSRVKAVVQTSLRSAGRLAPGANQGGSGANPLLLCSLRAFPGQDRALRLGPCDKPPFGTLHSEQGDLSVGLQAFPDRSGHGSRSKRDGRTHAFERSEDILHIHMKLRPRQSLRWPKSWTGCQV
jgi:hypothetical protein